MNVHCSGRSTLRSSAKDKAAGAGLVITKSNMCQGLIDSMSVIEKHIRSFSRRGGDDDVLKSPVITQTLSNHKETFEFVKKRFLWKVKNSKA